MSTNFRESQLLILLQPHGQNLPNLRLKNRREQLVNQLKLQSQKKKRRKKVVDS